MSSPSQPITVPRAGMLATVRNRRGLIVQVDAYDPSGEARMHLVRVEYIDGDGAPEDSLIWEREVHRSLLEPTALPRVADEPPTPADELDALVRASRWSALSPFLAPNGSGERSALPIASPFFGAVEVEDFQLVPLLRALEMPRISLLLADDVGLGKTIEAGLILTELLLRRRVRRVLVLTPASLKNQWQQEMRDKFSLSFDIVGREETHALQTRLGLEANPWRTFPRIIASYYYLRQPDVLEQLRATFDTREAGYQLPWDLLIVDEAHNLMPASLGQDSDLAEMLQAISPYFEHKLFLTATPHNGHTRSFTGLLEQLDPVRFTRSPDIDDAYKKRIETALVRRLKSEVNALDDERGRPRRFSERFPAPLPVYFGKGEAGLSSAFSAFRAAVRSAVGRSKSAERRAGSFAVEVLNKRLLSCPTTFADSWLRFREGLTQDEPASTAEVAAARRASEEDIDDDRERESRVEHAARTAGAWLRSLATSLAEPIAAVDKAIERLGISEAVRSDPKAPLLNASRGPLEDARLERLFGFIDKELRRGKNWHEDERLVVFTEYKTTLDYLEAMLRARYDDRGSAIRVLYGGLDMKERDVIKRSFNDPLDPVRVLLATDAAAEGLNLQETARFLLHYDIPWNPSRLEQRNGRLDRHGQARDVRIFHFTSENDADLQFLGRVVDKVHTIREDLGSLGELFDAAFQRRFEDLEAADDVDRKLSHDIAKRRGQVVVPRDAATEGSTEEAARIAALKLDIDFSPDTVRDTLEVALGVGVGRPRLEGPDAAGRVRLLPPFPKRWDALIDESLRLQSSRGTRGALPGLVFDAKCFIHDVAGRPVFRPSPDAVLLHLGHPMLREALATFARLRFPGRRDVGAPSRWTLRRGPLPAGCSALLLVTVEELAVNELREPFHHWVRTLRFPVRGRELGQMLPYLPPATDAETAGPAWTPRDEVALREAKELWVDLGADVQDSLKAYARDLTKQLKAVLAAVKKSGIAAEKRRYEERIREVEVAMRSTTIEKLQKEIDKLTDQGRQLLLSAFEDDLRERRIAELTEERHRREGQYQHLLEFLKKEQQRVIENMLPRRYDLHGGVQVFPVAVEIRLASKAGAK